MTRCPPDPFRCEPRPALDLPAPRRTARRRGLEFTLAFSIAAVVSMAVALLPLQAHAQGTAGSKPQAPGGTLTINLPAGTSLPEMPKLPPVPQTPPLPLPSVTINIGGATAAPAAVPGPAATPAAAPAAQATPTSPAGTAPALAPKPVPVPAPASAAVPALAPAATTAPAAPAVMSRTATPPGAGPLEFTTADLPPARVGRRYGPLPLVRNDGGALVFDVAGDLSASGLEVTQAGVLQGDAAQAGAYRFTLTVIAAPGVAAPLRQTFTLRVLPARSATPAAAVAAARPAPAPPALLPREMLDELPALTSRPRALSWKLAAADLEKLAAAVVEAFTRQEDDQLWSEGFAPVRGAEPSASAAEAGTKALARLQGLLPGLVDVEYPTRALFESALEAQGRGVCLKAEKKTAELARRDVDARACDAPPPAAVAAAAPQRAAPKAARPAAAPAASAAATATATAKATTSPLTPQQAQAELLPRTLMRAVGALAARQHELDSALPVRWSGGGCGCSPVHSDYFSYGMVPFWLPGDEPQQVDFSAYTRLGYLGALLADDGSLLLAKPWNDESAAGLVRALNYGVGLDLVLYRRDWAPLLAQTGAARAAMLRRTAQELMARVDTPLQAWWRPLQRLALPQWRQTTHLYSGVTLFFDELPAEENAQRYLVDLVSEIVARMEGGDRSYALNVVVRAERLMAGDASQGVANAVRLLERTGSIAPAGQAGLGAGANPKVPPRVAVRLLVLLPEPTTDTKKSLRAALDQSGALQSHQRVDFLDSLVPMMAHPAGDKVARMAPEMAFQFDADLAYHGWQYGGAGLWPLALHDRGTGAQAIELLHANFRANERWWRDRWTVTHEMCTWVCPYRTWWRLGLNGLLLLGGLSLGLYLFNCRLRERGGRAFVIWLWGGLALTGAVFWIMLTCDPDLDALSEGNKPLVALFATVLLVALWFLTKRRAPKP